MVVGSNPAWSFGISSSAGRARIKTHPVILPSVSVRSEEIQRRGLGRQNASDPTQFAEVAQLVEHDLAKVGVASSNLVFRSK